MQPMHHAIAPSLNQRNIPVIFTSIKALTGVYALATAATIIFIWFARQNQALVDSTRRAARGSRSAYRRLRIVSIVIPVVSIGLVAIPGLFPSWMNIEQLVYALLLLAVALLANRASVQFAFANPA